MAVKQQLGYQLYLNVFSYHSYCRVIDLKKRKKKLTKQNTGNICEKCVKLV